MITQELLEYIKEQVGQGIGLEVIKNNLNVSGGWSIENIDTAFRTLNVSTNPSAVAEDHHLTIPHAVVMEVAYAGFWIRAVALITDGMIVGIVTPILVFILFACLKINLDSTLVFGFQTLLVIIYFVWMTNAKGATLGKMMVGIQVLSVEEKKPELSKIILRETIGRFLSFITLSIGYIMAGFTLKKQALHDKLAGTVVVYNNPNKKIGPWAVVAIIIAGILPLIAILGILSSVVLASLSVAREKGSDLMVGSAVASTTIDALSYDSAHNTFSGFKPTIYTIPDCSDPILTHISTNGLAVAVFGKSCTQPDTYFCEFIDTSSTTNAQSILSTNTISATSIPDNKVDCQSN